MTLVRSFTGTRPLTPMPKGAIDTQTHMYLPGFPSAPGSMALPEAAPGVDEYRQVMARLGVGRLIVTQGNAHGTDNASLLASLEMLGDIAWGVAAVPADVTDAEMDRLAAGRVIGLRIMDLPGGAVGLKDVARIDALAAERGWMVAVQFNGTDLLSHLPALAAMKSRWVFDHHGKFLNGITPAHVDALKGLIGQGNVWFKFAACYEASTTGGPDYADVADLARDIGACAPDRIVWGTNWPHNSAKTTADYPDDAKLTDLPLSWLPDDDARHRALITNPEELFALPKFG